MLNFTSCFCFLFQSLLLSTLPLPEPNEAPLISSNTGNGIPYPEPLPAHEQFRSGVTQGLVRYTEDAEHVLFQVISTMLRRWWHWITKLRHVSDFSSHPKPGFPAGLFENSSSFPVFLRSIHPFLQNTQYPTHVNRSTADQSWVQSNQTSKPLKVKVQKPLLTWKFN